MNTDFLKHHLETLYGQYQRQEFLSSDPLEFPHRFSNPWDIEAVALLSALLAYGNVRQIRRSLTDLLHRIHSLEESPSFFVRKLLSNRHFLKNARLHFQDFTHRFNIGDDIIGLLLLLGRTWEQSGSLGAFFLDRLHSEDPDIENALNQLIQTWKNWSHKARYPRGPFFNFLLTSPQDGSTCKRWCLFLRWMGRKDELDLGLWTQPQSKDQIPTDNHSLIQKYRATFPTKKFLSPHQLIIPLDIHAGRISRHLGLTTRKSQDWKMSLEVTESLRHLCHEDPVRFDFAITRPGILKVTPW